MLIKTAVTHSLLTQFLLIQLGLKNTVNTQGKDLCEIILGQHPEEKNLILRTS